MKFLTLFKGKKDTIRKCYQLLNSLFINEINVIRITIDISILFWAYQGIKYIIYLLTDNNFIISENLSVILPDI